MAVAAISTGHDVVGINRARDTDGYRFLAVRQMGAAANVTLAEQLLNPVLDAADFDHALKLVEPVLQRFAPREGRIGIGDGHAAFLHQGAGLKQMIDDTRKVIKLTRRDSLRLEGRLKQSLAEHRAILKALRSRDPDQAGRTMHDHLLSGRAAVAKLQSVR